MPPSTPEVAGEVARRIAAGEPCWFPGLADLLVSRFWRGKRRVAPPHYSTETWLSGRPPRATLAVSGQAQMAIEELPAAFHARFEAPPFAAMAPRAAPAVAAAIPRLEPMGGGEAVARLVRCVHCISALGAGYDSSHSEPSIPFSVFVSIPLGERHAELRLAESLLHEAMHLQLTLIEREAAIVVNVAGGGYSPWQQSERPVQGLLHGLYVFAAIHQWLRFLRTQPGLPPADREYVNRRSREIEEEIGAVAWLHQAPALTDFGRGLADWLLKPFCTMAPPSQAVGAVAAYVGTSWGK